ncbi:hypothetical protein N0V90_005037 [Kalmusia sp. IMI 367209]|nr:hypothetical protein N0V90_005037 [Kalmusia sp. IMI 367209]
MAPEIQTVVENIALTTERSSLLSYLLYDIGARLVESSINPAITAIAQEFAELADLAQRFGEILTNLTNGSHHINIDQLLESVRETFDRLEKLMNAFETEIKQFDPRRFPNQFKRIFKDENIRDLTSTCRSLKEPLRLELSVLKIAHENQQRNKRSKKKKREQDVVALTRECELAESWVQASRQVIKELLNAERRFQKSHISDTLQLSNWTESYVDTALWMYNLIFIRAFKLLPVAQRSNARGRIKTVLTTDGNGTASDSERDEITDHFPKDLERELLVTNVKGFVVNELLQTWVGLNPAPIRQITDSMREKNRNRERHHIEDSVSSIILWYTNNKESALRDESPLPTHRTSRGVSEKHEQDLDNQGNTTRTREEGSQRIYRVSEAPPPEVPSPPAPTSREDETSAVHKVVVPNRPSSPHPTTNTQTESEKGRKKETPFTVTTSDNVTKEGRRSYTFYLNPPAHEEESSSSRKPIASRDSAVVAKTGRSQINKRASNQQNVSRVNFDIDDRRPQHRKEEHPSSDGLASEGRHGGRSRSVQAGYATHTGVPREDSFWDDSFRTSSRPRRASAMLPDTTNSRGNVFPNTFGIAGHYVPPPSISNGTYYGFLPSHSTNGYIPNHHEHSGILEDRKNAELVGLQQRMDEYVKEVKAREQAWRDEEEARKEEGRKKAQEDENRMTKQRQEVEELRKRMWDLQESGHRNEEKWEKEKRSIERKIEDWKIPEEQASRRTEAAMEMHTPYRSEDRLWDLVSNLQENERRKENEWAIERHRIVEEAQTQLKRAADEGEEEKQAAIEEVISEYKEKLKAEQENVRKAEIKAERYVSLYNAQFAPGHEEPDAMSGSTRAPDRPPDPFDYYDKDQHSSSGTSVDDGSVIETQIGMMDNRNPWDDGFPYNRFAAKGQIRHNTGSVASSLSDEASNVIIFPPRAGWSEFGPNQLGNYLSSSGFKAMFEQRERPTQGAHGRFEKIGTSGNVLRGTLFWQPPASTAEADLHKSLRNCGWRPTYVRTTGKCESRSWSRECLPCPSESGQTWFFGAQPVHAQFFSGTLTNKTYPLSINRTNIPSQFADMYKPQVTPFDISRATRGSEKESLIISKDLVEVEELDFLGHMYKEKDGAIFLDPTLTPEDIDHVVARSFLAREGRYRKKFRDSGLRFSSPKIDIVEVTSEPGDRESDASSKNKERRSSLWPLWGMWSG